MLNQNQVAASYLLFQLDLDDLETVRTHSGCTEEEFGDLLSGRHNDEINSGVEVYESIPLKVPVRCTCGARLDSVPCKSCYSGGMFVELMEQFHKEFSDAEGN
jgi:hypothetical protein